MNNIVEVETQDGAVPPTDPVNVWHGREVECASIHIGNRFRQDMGDLAGLADSIAKEGLLQPVGIAEDGQLVFGERRLRAVMDVLKRDTIAARIVNVTSILAGEYDENVVRKDFTPSERVAIAQAIQAELGNRQGQRTDIQLQGNFPEVHPGVQTRDIAAQKAGFGNAKTYEQARSVVEHGTEEVVEQMETGELAISAAALIADESPAEQKKIVAMPPAERKDAVRKLRAKPKAKAKAATGKVASDSLSGSGKALEKVAGIMADLAATSRSIAAVSLLDKARPAITKQDKVDWIEISKTVKDRLSVFVKWLNSNTGDKNYAAARKPTKAATRTGTKNGEVIAMLKREGGATLAEIMAHTGWGNHTTRGWLSGFRKKTGIAVESFKSDKGERTYRISA